MNIGLRLAALPVAWITLAVEAGNHNDASVLDEVNKAVGEAAHKRSPLAFVNHGEAERILRDGLYAVIDCPDESLRQLRAHFGVPQLGGVEFRFRPVGPYDRQAHRLGSPAFTCSHGVTAEGSFS